MSLEREADRLVKRLYYHMALYKQMAPTARQLGWNDFSIDYPITDDQVEMAFEAFISLGFKDGVWKNTPKLLMVVVGFLEEELSITPTKPQLEELKTMLSKTDISVDALWAWFDNIYSYDVEE